jgi:hypothetical protein
MHSIQLLSRSRLTPHQHTRVLRRRTDTGSQTRTSSRTTHYEIEPPAVSGHQPPPGRTQTSPGPGTILPGAPNPRRAFGHVHRPMGKGGVSGTTLGGPWMYLLGHRHRASLRVRLRLGRHCIRHPAWAVIQHHTPGYTPVPWTWHPNRDCPFRASNNRPETNPPHCTALARHTVQPHPGGHWRRHTVQPQPGGHWRRHTVQPQPGGGTGDDTQGTSTGHSRPIGRPTLPYTNIYIY